MTSLPVLKIKNSMRPPLLVCFQCCESMHAWESNGCGCAGTLFTERGTIVTVFIVCYALTSFVAGYVRCGMLATACVSCCCHAVPVHAVQP